MERIKSRQQKFRRGKEKLLSLTQDSFRTEGKLRACRHGRRSGGDPGLTMPPVSHMNSDIIITITLVYSLCSPVCLLVCLQW
ncbi:Piezo-type mechanosensitive ion channel component 2 [Dissostichus eleginoides]|uniref:Piezo-type mechanosensitive ion channel component 2 n=1 Tax=Dissostichus eleginoides TaxID=100907 RepID=A0AAD9F452_DISEL|nr:Piezo-type mechanosensitive ion channel component 2 [Dissostichus eleginoides]